MFAIKPLKSVHQLLYIERINKSVNKKEMDVPCTLIFQSTDEVQLPTDMLFVVTKELLKFKQQEARMSGKKVVIKLGYSPRGARLVDLFGNMPIKYVRTNLRDQNELDLFEAAIRRFQINMVALPIEQSSQGEEPEEVISLDDEDEDTQDLPAPTAKNKRSAPRTTTTNTSLKRMKTSGGDHSPEDASQLG